MELIFYVGASWLISCQAEVILTRLDGITLEQMRESMSIRSCFQLMPGVGYKGYPETPAEFCVKNNSDKAAFVSLILDYPDRVIVELGPGAEQCQVPTS